MKVAATEDVEVTTRHAVLHAELFLKESIRDRETVLPGYVSLLKKAVKQLERLHQRQLKGLPARKIGPQLSFV